MYNEKKTSVVSPVHAMHQDKIKNTVLKKGSKLAPNATNKNFDKHSQVVKTNTLTLLKNYNQKIQVQKSISVVLARPEQQRHNKTI